ncbi:16S rRNA processing protein RimM [Chlorobaculum limnaeum]|uniref:Ribosome maturation factor RimM n=1 Tax=Chlorobaculum limnaeum TaxID=274537 RepID=A0A1D8D592_CHLLM|nr:ribosome maturation factor RimM [Chlorobaculum limnaeum]AOS83604.1 16S rRNA processing protein RimM [Chlorobaculum limnaeum]
MELFLTGIVLKPKGLKGELKVKPVTDFPESFLKRREYYVGKTPEAAVLRKVVSAKLNQGFAWIVLEGAGSREAAEALAGCGLYVTGDALESLPDGRAYIHDLIGLDAFDEAEGRVGKISDVLQMPAHDVYEVDTGSGKVLVPAVEDFIIETDLEKGIVMLRRFREFM